MNRTVAICSILCWVAVWLAIVVATPWMLSDQNQFLKGFVNHELLGFMGVIVTITLASASNLYIELNKLEAKAGAGAFSKSKADVRHSAFTLIGALVGSVILAIVKPIVICGARSEATVNGLAISILLLSALVLIDLTKAGFSLDPTGI